MKEEKGLDLNGRKTHENDKLKRITLLETKPCVATMHITDIGADRIDENDETVPPRGQPLGRS